MVNRFKKFYLLTISLIIFTAVFLYWRMNMPITSDLPSVARLGISDLPIIELQDIFYDKINFANALAKAENIKPRSDIYSLIAPHDLLASGQVAELMKMASGRPINLVVIIGPNHGNIGTKAAATAKVQWQTVNGYLETDQIMVDSFAHALGLVSDPGVFAKEHSVGVIAQFVKYYLPGAKILPIVFSSYASERQAREVGQWLASELSPDSLAVFSIDFSHYLTKDQAELKDKTTQELILKKDIAKILRLTNDNVDSPASLATSLIYASQRNLTTGIIRHTNSFDLSVIKPESTTSHFGIIFYKN